MHPANTDTTTETTTTKRHTTTTRTSNATLEAWARHATSSNGFGDAFTPDAKTLPFTKA